jgi:hypothetical protein
MRKERSLNLLVTTVHIAVLLGFTVVAILMFNVSVTDGTESVNAVQFRVQSVWTLLSGV